MHRPGGRNYTHETKSMKSTARYVLALSKGPNISGVSPPHVMTEIDPVSNILCS
jgi:hypothetical protein